MVSNIKNNKKELVSRQGGFIELIILIIITLFVMKYFGITMSGIINWFLATFHNVLK